MEIESKIVLSILIPFAIGFYILALWQLKQSTKEGLIDWTIVDKNEGGKKNEI